MPPDHASAGPSAVELSAFRGRPGPVLDTSAQSGSPCRALQEHLREGLHLVATSEASFDHPPASGSAPANSQLGAHEAPAASGPSLPSHIGLAWRPRCDQGSVSRILPNYSRSCLLQDQPCLGAASSSRACSGKTCIARMVCQVSLALKLRPCPSHPKQTHRALDRMQTDISQPLHLVSISVQLHAQHINDLAWHRICLELASATMRPCSHQAEGELMYARPIQINQAAVDNHDGICLSTDRSHCDQAILSAVCNCNSFMNTDLASSLQTQVHCVNLHQKEMELDFKVEALAWQGDVCSSDFASQSGLYYCSIGVIAVCSYCNLIWPAISAVVTACARPVILSSSIKGPVIDDNITHDKHLCVPTIEFEPSLSDISTFQETSIDGQCYLHLVPSVGPCGQCAQH